MTDKKTCTTCTAWSQLLAETFFESGRHGIRAACLNPKSPRYVSEPDRWPGERDGCDQWTDDPAMADLPIGEGEV